MGCGGELLRGDTGRYKIKSKLALETTLLILWGQWVWARLKTTIYIYGVSSVLLTRQI